ncbi:hypothetical protein K6631_06835 [Escherichia coli]|uniref:tail fiber domain-containing protein n=1 Tax=Escherichia coli TaxID=562 RepID=UPI001C9B1B5E|nr:hypothetical protein [Escherichia coli]MBY7334197.1 hypothetical protein [Escherichia coli]MBY7475376.1 hypothetical protein [Escherichia coli]
MADQIFTGSGFKLFYNDDTANRIPDNAGNELVNELAAMPSFGIDSQVQTIEVYNSEFSEKLLAEQNVNNVDIVVNYVPDCTAHAFLDQATKDQTEFQLTLQYDVSDGIISYSMVNGMISSARLAGDKDSVVTKSYTFTPTDVLVRDGQAPLSTGLVVGSYGVGSNGVDVPQYEPQLPNGNSFIKVPAARVDNPASADLMGIGLIDNGTFSSIAMTKSGTLAIYAKNQNTAWTRILTATQISDQYVPLTRTINGRALSTNISITKGDVGLSNVTNDAQLKIASNLSDLADNSIARTNLGLSRFQQYANPVGETRVVSGDGNMRLFVKNDGTWGVWNGTANASQPLPILQGGTGASTAEQARTNLGILSSSEVSNLYVPKTTTINGKALTGNISITKGDVGLSNVTNDAQLKIASNLSDVADVTTSRNNIKAPTVGGGQIIAVPAPPGVEADKYYPVIIDLSYDSLYTTGAHIDLYTKSSSGGDPMNSAQFNGFIRTGGWTDRGDAGYGYYNCYAPTEKALNCILGSAKVAEDKIAVYVEGRAFPVRMRIPAFCNAFAPTASYTAGTDVVYPWGVADPISTAVANGTRALFDFRQARPGFYMSNSSTTTPNYYIGGGGRAVLSNGMNIGENITITSPKLTFTGNIEAGNGFIASGTGVNDFTFVSKQLNSDLSTKSQSEFRTSDGAIQLVWRGVTSSDTTQFFNFNSDGTFSSPNGFLSSTGQDWNGQTSIVNRSRFLAGSVNGPDGTNVYGGTHTGFSGNYGFQIVGRQNKAFFRTIEAGTNGTWNQIPTLNLANTWAGTQSFTGNLSITGKVTSPITIEGGSPAFILNQTGTGATKYSLIGTYGNITLSKNDTFDVIKYTSSTDTLSTAAANTTLKNLSVTGNLSSTGTLTTTGSLNAASLTTTGSVNADTIVATGSIDSASLTTTGSVTSGSISTGTVTASGDIISSSKLVAQANYPGLYLISGRVDDGTIGKRVYFENNGEDGLYLFMDGHTSTTNRKTIRFAKPEANTVMYVGYNGGLAPNGNSTDGGSGNDFNIQYQGWKNTGGTMLNAPVSGSVYGSLFTQCTQGLDAGPSAATGSAGRWYQQRFYDTSNRIFSRIQTNASSWSAWNQITMSAVSDQSVKTIQGDLDTKVALSNINRMEFKDFTFNDTPDKARRGVISQQIRTIDPQYVNKIGELYHLDQTPMLLDGLAAIQELSKENDTLKAQIADQQLQLDELRAVVTQLLIAQNK